MPWPISIRITEERPAWADHRGWRELLKASHAAMGRLYVSFIPRHFRPGAQFRYGYRPRSKKYADPVRGAKVRAQRRGQAIAGPETPLVFTGLLRRAATQFFTIRAYPTRMTYRATAPSYVPDRPRTAKHPPLADEVTRVTPGERRELEGVLEQQLRIRANVLHSRRIRLIR